MNEHYEKYSKNKRTSLIINYDTKEKLNQVMIRLGKKLTYENIILKLIDNFVENEDKIKNQLFNENN
jgi:hypothetical protein